MFTCISIPYPRNYFNVIQKSLCRFLSRGIDLLYKSNYLDSLMAACGTTSRAIKTVLKPSLTVQLICDAFFGGPTGTRIITSQCEWGIRIVLFAENNPPDCFLHAQTLAGSSQAYLRNQNHQLNWWFAQAL